jgi:DNA-binding PucR family transcriptional regulator
MADDELTPAIRRAARRFEERAPALAGPIAEQIHVAMPEFGSSTAVTASTRASIRGGMSGFARMLQHEGSPVRIPPEALEYVEAYVRRGIDISLLLRSYRLGHQHMWRAWREMLGEEELTPDDMLVVLERTDDAMFAYMDAIVGELLEHYRAERERWHRSAGAMRLETVSEILAGEPVDAETASRRLRYELEREHVALVAWEEPGSSEPDLARAEQAVRVGAEAVGDPQPLVVAAGSHVAWGWAGSRSAVAPEALRRLGDMELPDGVRLCFGEPARGVAGFRSSHDEAIVARRIVRSGTVRARGAVRWQEVALLGLLSADLERATRFVTAELGPLAASDETMERLRETLWAFFQEGEQVKRTAQRLGVHQNTVSYRLRQADELVGRSIRERPVELQGALLLCDWLRGAGAEHAASADD